MNTTLVSDSCYSRSRDINQLHILQTLNIQSGNLTTAQQSTSKLLSEQMKADKEVLTTVSVNLHVKCNKMLSSVLSGHICIFCICMCCLLFFFLVHVHCSSTAVHGSASQSIHMELAAHRSRLLRQRQPSALLLHTDVWFEGNLSGRVCKRLHQDV